MSVEGFISPGFERVAEALQANLDAGDDLGAGFAVVRDGETLLDIHGGFTDRTKTKPWARDTLTPVFSTSKGISALVVAWCVDESLLAYEDKVAQLWPEFAAHGKGELTIAQALSHQAGLPGFPERIDPTLWLDPAACAAALAELAPLWPPGSASGYHPLTWGYIIGEIVQRASGRSLGNILREEICSPANIDFYIGTPAREHHRAPEMQKPRQAAHFGEITEPRRAAFFTAWAGPPRFTAEWREIEIPSANGHGTALAVAQLYEAYGNGGVIGGRRVFSADTHAQLIARRIEGQDLVLPFVMDWRSGAFGNNNNFYGASPDAVGHSGSGGSCGFGDPARRLGVGYVMNKQSHYLMGDPRALRLIEALYACLSS